LCGCGIVRCVLLPGWGLIDRIIEGSASIPVIVTENRGVAPLVLRPREISSGVVAVERPGVIGIIAGRNSHYGALPILIVGVMDLFPKGRKDSLNVRGGLNVRISPVLGIDIRRCLVERVGHAHHSLVVVICEGGHVTQFIHDAEKRAIDIVTVLNIRAISVGDKRDLSARIVLKPGIVRSGTGNMLEMVI